MGKGARIDEPDVVPPAAQLERGGDPEDPGPDHEDRPR
jgi:hypothetical protein